MHHLHVDRFAGIKSPIHRMDPRAKIVSALILVFSTVLTPDNYFLSFALYLSVISVIISVSRIPVMYMLERSLLIIPFALMVSVFVPFITPGSALFTLPLGFMEAVATREGMVRFTAIGLKSLISFLTMLTLVSTTRFLDLMKAAGSLGFPAKLAVVLTFMYRYLFILIDDASHMLLARELRAGGGKHHSILTASGGIVGALFVRSFEHAERLYFGMLMRGYSGRPSTLTAMKIGGRDIIFSVLAASGAIMIFMIGVLFHG